MENNTEACGSNQTNKEKEKEKEVNIHRIYLGWQPKVHYFKGEKFVTPELLISLANTEFSYNYFIQKGTYKKGVSVNNKIRDIPLEKMLARSLKKNNINPNNREAVEKFAVSLIHDFAYTLEDMMIEDNYLFHFPQSRKSYIFLAQLSSKSRYFRFDYKHEGAYYNTFFIKHVFTSMHSKCRFVTKRIKQYSVGLKNSVRDRIWKSMEKGRRYLPFEAYVNYINAELPYYRFFREFLVKSDYEKKKYEEWKQKKSQTTNGSYQPKS